MITSSETQYCVDSLGFQLFRKVHVPMGIWKKAIGLLGNSEIDSETAMLLPNCSSIHMFGMRFPIDVAFLDKDYTVVKCVEGLKPWRIAYSWSASHTLEMRMGMLARRNIAVGSQLRFMG